MITCSCSHLNINQIAYRKKLENLTLDVEGRAFQMLVFRGSPKSSRKSQSPHMIDEIRRSDEDISNHKPLRQFPKVHNDMPEVKISAVNFTFPY